MEKNKNYIAMAGFDETFDLNEADMLIILNKRGYEDLEYYVYTSGDYQVKDALQAAEGKAFPIILYYAYTKELHEFVPLDDFCRSAVLDKIGK